MTTTISDPNAVFKIDHTSSNQCGVTLMNNTDGHDIAQVMRGKANVSVRELPSMIRVDATRKLEFNLPELSDVLGRELSPADFEEVMSTHYGRMVVQDDRILFFANPEDAAEFIDFDLKPVK